MKEIKERAGFTVCNVSYFETALVAAQSFIRFSEESDFFIFIFDEKSDLHLTEREANINIIWADSLQLENYGYLTFVYNVIELTTAYKPLLAIYLLDLNYRQVVFTDPDTYYFDGWKRVEAIIQSTTGTILTPHYFGQKLDVGTTEAKLLKFGFFNLGWFCVDQFSVEFLKWWWYRTREFARNMPQSGEFTDQRWVETAFCRFTKNMSILPYVGCNVSYWNLFERNLTKHDDKFLVNHDDLAMYHWSAYDKTSDNKSKYSDVIVSEGTKMCLSEMSELYLSEFRSVNYNLKYGYDYFENGKKISDALRQMWSVRMPYSKYGDENLHSIKGGSYKMAKQYLLFGRNKVLETGKAPQISQSNYMILYIVKKIILFAGYKQHSKLSSLFVYLSNYKNYL